MMYLRSTGVSPKVILVMLQKEQGLVADDWPFLKQYRSATGLWMPRYSGLVIVSITDSTTKYYNGANQFSIDIENRSW
jgi:hypothetical protein